MKKQSKYNLNWSNKQIDKCLCRFCKNISLKNQKTCSECYLKTFALNRLGDRSFANGLLDLLMKQDFKCYLTGKELVLGDNASIDHFIPVSLRPDLKHDFDNIRWCDKAINRLKNDFTYEELLKICKCILEYNFENN